MFLLEASDTSFGDVFTQEGALARDDLSAAERGRDCGSGIYLTLVAS